MPFPSLGLGAAAAGIGSMIGRFLVPYIIIKMLVGFGVVLLSISGTTWLKNYIETQIFNYFDGITGALSQIFIMAGVLDGLTIMVNAWVAAITLKTLIAGSKKMKIA